MKDEQLSNFQDEVAGLLIRNSNILDIMTKIQTSCAKMCRSAAKSATGCGCTTITAKKGKLSETDYYVNQVRESGVEGKLCAECKSFIEAEIGETLFYMASLCNALGLSLSDIAESELKSLTVLGKYNLR